MIREKAWCIFLSILAVVAISYAAPLGYRLYLFSYLNTKASPQQMQWTVKKVSDETYLPEAQYNFTYHNESYHGQYLFEETGYRNHWAATKAIERLSKQHQTVWFSASSPQFSVLEKKIPLKKCIYSLTLIGIFAYFLFLRYYVKNHKENPGI